MVKITKAFNLISIIEYSPHLCRIWSEYIFIYYTRKCSQKRCAAKMQRTGKKCVSAAYQPTAMA